MSRLRKTLLRKALNSFRDLRTKRRYVFAEWVPKDINDPNVIQYVTDVMALGGAMQIQYQDGGYRTIYPYGWNTSKEGNILIMCYKDDGGIRSYRLDRIQQFLFDSDLLEQSGEQVEEETQDSLNPSLEISDYNSEDTENQLPSLPPENVETQPVERELPYDEALDILDQSQISSEDEFLDEPEIQQNLEYDENQYDPNRAASNKRRLMKKKGDLYE